MPNPTIPVLQVLITEAMETIAQFTGSAEDATRDSAVQDAIEVISGLTPLLEDFGRGTDITLDDARVSLVDMDAAIARLDQEADRQAGA